MNRLQSVNAFAERSDDAREFQQQLRSPWLTTLEACDYLRYTGKHRLRSLYRFLAKNGIPTSRRSARAILIARVDLDRAIGAWHRKRSA